MTIPTPEYLIDCILPSREVHLLGGPTGAGKTRWLFQTLLQWQAGLPIFGFRSHPVPWIYIAADRSAAAAKRTLNDMQLDPERIPLIPAWDQRLSLDAIMEAAKKSHARLAVIEAFGSFVDGNSKVAVKQFLSAVHNAACAQDLTIIGVMESPKMKPKDRYENPRQRISGVASWGHFTETIFLIEPSNSANPREPGRMLYVCPRNGPGLMLEGEILPPHGIFTFAPGQF